MAAALASAYSFNPEINSARAQTRADDENVPIAKAARRPTISGYSTVTGVRSDLPLNQQRDKHTLDGAFGLQVTQNIFTGFRATNAIREAETGVLASRETLRNTVQNVLFDAAQAYQNVIRDAAIVEIRKNNVLFLEEQVRAANERFNVGENTRTDVAQARASLASARAAVSLALSNLAISRATYRQVIGHDPSRLTDGFPYGRLIPGALGAAVAAGENAHPVILAAIHSADAQAFAVKQAEGALLPTVSVTGTLQHAESFDTDTDPNTLTVKGSLSIPIFQGGVVSAQVRQAKEVYGLRKIQIDVARDQVRAAIVSAWAQEEAARGAIKAAREGIDASELALSGVQEEQKVGQRTTLDVLDAQQVLLNARETLISAQHDGVVARFSLLSAMGRLTAEALGLPGVYNPSDHYEKVRNKWYGLTTPDGR